MSAVSFGGFPWDGSASSSCLRKATCKKDSDRNLQKRAKIEENESIRRAKLKFFKKSIKTP